MIFFSILKVSRRFSTIWSTQRSWERFQSLPLREDNNNECPLPQEADQRQHIKGKRRNFSIIQFVLKYSAGYYVFITFTMNNVTHNTK